MIGNDGFECHAHCPVPCPADQMTCPSGYDYKGCPMEETCESGGKYSKISYNCCIDIKKFFFKTLHTRPHSMTTSGTMSKMRNIFVSLFVLPYVLMDMRLVLEKLIMMDVQQKDFACPHQVSESMN